MPYREIIGRKQHQEPSQCTPAWSRSRIRSWRAGTRVTTVTLSCGHTKAYRGDYVPKAQALCKECSDA